MKDRFLGSSNSVSLVILLYILLEINYMGLRVFESFGNSIMVQFLHSIMIILIILKGFGLEVLVMLLNGSYCEMFALV